MFEPRFLGSATIGEKGQIVIPVEARNALDLKTGEKLLVMSGPNGKGLMLMQPAILEKMTTKMTERFLNLSKKSKEKTND